jgi:hypothetical protein
MLQMTFRFSESNLKANRAFAVPSSSLIELGIQNNLRAESSLDPQVLLIQMVNSNIVDDY